MPEMSTEQLRAAVLRAWASDPDFAVALSNDPSKAIESRYGRQAYAVRVIPPEDNQLPIVIPRKTPDAVAIVEGAFRQSASATPTQSQFVFTIVRRAWSDPNFLSTLVADPKTTLNDLLAQWHGRKLDDELRPVVHIEQDGECCIAIPPGQCSVDAPLTDSDLEKAAGGGIGTISVAVALIGGAVLAISNENADGDCE